MSYINIIDKYNVRQVVSYDETGRTIVSSSQIGEETRRLLQDSERDEPIRTSQQSPGFTMKNSLSNNKS